MRPRPQTSTSLQHVPLDLTLEKEATLGAALIPRLSFAKQKLAEIVAVANGTGKVRYTTYPTVSCTAS
jgi:hypothetical protein